MHNDGDRTAEVDFLKDKYYPGVRYVRVYLKLSQPGTGFPTFFKWVLVEKNLNKVGNPSDNFKCTPTLPTQFRLVGVAAKPTNAGSK